MNSLDSAWQLYRLGRLDDARRAAGAYIREIGESAPALALIAYCEIADGRPEDGLRAAKAALRVEPDNEQALDALAVGLEATGNEEAALEAWEEAISRHPESTWLLLRLARALVDHRYLARARLTLERIRSLDPGAEGLLELDALTMFEDGRFDRAEPIARAALQANPESALAHATLGWVLLGRRKAHEAREALREALRLDPQFEWARLGFLEALSAQNFLYALLLAPHIWARTRTGWKRHAASFLIVGGPFVLLGASAAFPPLLYVAYAAFAPLLMLVFGPGVVGGLLAIRTRFHPVQRHYLKRDERIRIDSGIVFVFATLGGGLLSELAAIAAQLWILVWAAVPFVLHAWSWPPGENRLRARTVAIALPAVVGLLFLLVDPSSVAAGLLRLTALLLFGYWVWKAPSWAREDKLL